MRLQKRMLAVGTAMAAYCVSATALAAYDSSIPGWTEVISCSSSTFSDMWGHSSSQWGMDPPPYVWGESGQGWETYADTGDSSLDCGSWLNGTIAGGATYDQGSASVPQGISPAITTFWDDDNHVMNSSGTCGHQHTSMYVWGWRYNGSSWSYEFVEANGQSTEWDAQYSTCRWRAGNHSDWLMKTAGFAFGSSTIFVNNSPYAVLYIKSQATSHRSAGCGPHGCFHPVSTAVAYLQ